MYRSWPKGVFGASIKDIGTAGRGSEKTVLRISPNQQKRLPNECKLRPTKLIEKRKTNYLVGCKSSYNFQISVCHHLFFSVHDFLNEIL